ncbi:HEAT repeat domain-containing protein [bacterium]|nr:HEAT repeat domain-containing protein [bacterium]MCI0601834.1 HEAT repeat domain-containing protein [bacterium]
MQLFNKMFGPNIEKLQRNGEVHKLIDALSHKDTQIQVAAIRALGELRALQALPKLIQLLNAGIPILEGKQHSPWVN